MDTTVEKSIDYTKFKIIDGNRNINKTHVNNLIKSIEHNNLLHLRPIIVDEDYYILDGQHRFLAAQKLEKEFYFIKCTSESYKELITLNRNQKNWTLDDFINFYAVKFKNENYIKLIDLKEKHSLSLACTFLYLQYNIKKKKNREEFENGNFLFNYDLDKIEESINLWSSLHLILSEKDFSALDMLNSIYFRKGFLNFMQSRRINHEQFWNRINSNFLMLHRCFNYDQVLDMLLKIYNKQSPIVIQKGQLFI